MSQKNHTWENPMSLDKNIKDHLRRQKDRGYCKFTFTNNLEDEYTLAYLKITHVFEGRDAFVYEHCGLEFDQTLIIDDYAIGIDLNAQGEGKLHVSTTKTEHDKNDKNKKSKDNVYDRLYIHFIINKDNEQELFHHCYDQFFENNLMDLITTTDGKISEKILKLTNINVFFDPEFDKYDSKNKNEMYKLILQVVAPTGDRINIKPAELRN